MDQQKRQQIINKMDRALADKFGDEFNDLRRDESLQSAGLDSVDILDTIAILEKISGVYFERDELIEIDTLDELYDLVLKKVN